MIVTVQWETSDIKPGVKVLAKAGVYGGLAGIIIRQRGESLGDNVVKASKYAVLDKDNELATQFMTLSELAKLLTVEGCTDK